MPAFVVEVVKEDKRDSNYRCLKISNIGNGSAMNINFESIVHIHTKPTIHITKSIIGVESIPFMEAKKNPIILQQNGKSYNSEGVVTAVPINPQAFTDILLEYKKDNPCTLKLKFEDIEGTKYEQEIKIGYRVSIPGKVTQKTQA